MNLAARRGLVTLEQLCGLTGKTYRTIRQRLERLTPAKRTAKSLLYKAPEALAAIYATDPVPEPATMTELRRRKLRLEVDTLAHDFAAKQKRTVDVEHAASVVAASFSTCRARLLAIPPKIAPLLATVQDAEGVRAALADAVEEALAELTADDPDALAG